MRQQLGDLSSSLEHLQALVRKALNEGGEAESGPGAGRAGPGAGSKAGDPGMLKALMAAAGPGPPAVPIHRSAQLGVGGLGALSALKQAASTAAGGPQSAASGFAASASPFAVSAASGAAADVSATSALSARPGFVLQPTGKLSPAPVASEGPEASGSSLSPAVAAAVGGHTLLRMVGTASGDGPCCSCLHGPALCVCARAPYGVKLCRAWLADGRVASHAHATPAGTTGSHLSIRLQAVLPSLSCKKSPCFHCLHATLRCHCQAGISRARSPACMAPPRAAMQPRECCACMPSLTSSRHPDPHVPHLLPPHFASPA